MISIILQNSNLHCSTEQHGCQKS
uniref:Uncharacterized protein n=1 Tax=Arundo donax TaxID=35708 RepID=A0A0A8YPB4_ARUDO